MSREVPAVTPAMVRVMLSSTATTFDTQAIRVRSSLTPIRKPLVIGVGLLLLVFAGSSGTSQWRSFMLWRNGVDFGRKDPYFGRDIGFFVFDLPFWHYVVNLAMAALVVEIGRAHV